MYGSSRCFISSSFRGYPHGLDVLINSFLWLQSTDWHHITFTEHPCHDASDDFLIRLFLAAARKEFQEDVGLLALVGAISTGVG